MNFPGFPQLMWAQKEVALSARKADVHFACSAREGALQLSVFVHTALAELCVLNVPF